MIPGIIRRRVEELNVPHTALDEPTRKQALPPKEIGRFLADPVESLGRFGFVVDVKRLGSVTLHPESKFE